MYSDTPRLRSALAALTLLGAFATGCGGGDRTSPADSTPDTGGSGGSATGGSGGSDAGGTGGSDTGGTGGTGGSGGSGGAPPSNVVRLIAIGDTGEGNDDQHAVAAQIAAKCVAVGGCDAILMLGDNFYDVGVTGTDDQQWGPKFEAPYDLPELDGLKFYAVLGNHDYGLTSTGSAEAQVEYTYLPVGNGPGQRTSDKWMMPDTYYDVQFGPVHVFGIDSQDYSDTQRNDMTQRIANSNALWKIVTAHHPRYTSGDHAKDNWLVGNAGTYKILESTYCGTDMLLTGHDHNMEFIDKGRDADCPNTYFVISGAGSKTRSAGSFGLDKGEGFQRFYNEDIEGFAFMEFDGPNLFFQFIDKNGVVLWEKPLTK